MWTETADIFDLSNKILFKSIKDGTINVYIILKKNLLLKYLKDLIKINDVINN